MLLCGDWVFPVSSRPFPRGGVLILDGAIAAVGPAEELRSRYPAEEVREFPGCALLPGLVNSHTHLEYSAFRGLAPPCGFGEWMLRLLRARRKLDAEDIAVSALWGASECVRGGVTTIADASHDGWPVARAAGAAGLRGRVYQEVFGLDDAALPKTMRRLDAGLDRLEEECAAAGRGRLEAGISPHAPYTVSARLYRETTRLARRRGLRVATHVAESAAEVELLERGTGAIAFAYKAAQLWTGECWRPPGVSPVAYVSRSGGLGPEVLVVHAVQVDRADIAMLAESGIAVAHCPRSNLRLECGVAPLADLLAAGIAVGLGTDGLSSNDDLDMFAEMRAALRVSRERAPRGAGSGVGTTGVARDAAAGTGTAPLDAETVLRMATLDGARALGLEHVIGSLEVGKRADVIALRLPAALGAAAQAQPAAGPTVVTAALVETVSAADVQMTMVDGRVVYPGAPEPEDVTRRFAVVRAKLGLG